MTGITQSGNVTPGHIAVWTAPGYLQDGGPVLGPSETKLAQLLGANFNTTVDQAIPLPASGITKFILTRIVATNATVSLTTAQGGFYPQPSKGGTAIVSAAQAYSALTASGLWMSPTLSSGANNTVYTASNLTSFSVYFSLSVAQSVACTADIYLFGLVLG